jgi:hypothetical protein
MVTENNLNQIGTVSIVFEQRDASHIRVVLHGLPFVVSMFGGIEFDVVGGFGRQANFE